MQRNSKTSCANLWKIWAPIGSELFTPPEVRYIPSHRVKPRVCVIQNIQRLKHETSAVGSCSGYVRSFSSQLWNLTGQWSWLGVRTPRSPWPEYDLDLSPTPWSSFANPNPKNRVCANLLWKIRFFQWLTKLGE